MKISDERLAELIEQSVYGRFTDSRFEDDTSAALRELQQLRIPMSALTWEQRLDRRDKLMAGYCHRCGVEDPRGNCQCWNDE